MADQDELLYTLQDGIATVTPLLPDPFVTVTLGDLGADVLKIETPSGDFAQRMAGPVHEMVNRNKRTLALDLKNPAGPASPGG